MRDVYSLEKRLSRPTAHYLFGEVTGACDDWRMRDGTEKRVGGSHTGQLASSARGNQRFEHVKRPFLILAGMGATLGVVLDGLHTHFGATSYTNPVFAKASWWAPLLFAGAYTSGVVRPLLSLRPRLPVWKPQLGMALFVLAYALTVAPLDVSSRVALLIATFATGFYFCDPSRACLIVSLVGAFTGPFVESVLIRAGTFVHHEAHVAGVPVWLPVLYMNAGVGLGSFALWLVQTEENQSR